MSSNTPSSIEVTSLTNGSVIVNSKLVYYTAVSSDSLRTSISSSLTAAAAASSSSSFPVYSNSIAVTNCKCLWIIYEIK